MKRSDYVIGIIKAARRGDWERFDQMVACLIADARSKNHHRLADAYEHAAETGPAQRVSPVDQVDGALLELVPGRKLEDLTLDDQARSEIETLLVEHQQADRLHDAGLAPRNRVLLVGPPGNGKTSLAEVIATETKRPMFVLSDRVVSSYLGKTSKKLHDVFAFVSGRPCVLLLDEFDALSASRSYEHSAAKEMSRIVTSVLLWLERVPSQTIVVGATNTGGAVDHAMWRRMQLVLRLRPPTTRSAVEFLNRFTRRHGPLGIPPETVVGRVPDASYADLEQIALNMQRLTVVGVENAAETALARWKQRNTAILSRDA